MLPNALTPCVLVHLCVTLGKQVAFAEDKWSPSENEGIFAPSPSVLEQWSDLSTTEAPLPSQDITRSTAMERDNKVMRPTIPDRIVNKPPNKSPDASETDLFLLGAIEKLAYRVDFLEKRVKRMEEMIYQLVAGSASNGDDPCPEGFSRKNGVCYHFSAKLLNWKSASSMCRGMGAMLLELNSDDEQKKFVATIQAEKETQGHDYWTGGLNPGLLWLWGTSASPVVANGNQTSIAGNGRCLLLGYQPPTRSYQYKGMDCAARYRYICQVQDNTTERRLRKILEERAETQMASAEY